MDSSAVHACAFVNLHAWGINLALSHVSQFSAAALEAFRCSATFHEILDIVHPQTTCLQAECRSIHEVLKLFAFELPENIGSQLISKFVVICIAMILLPNPYLNEKIDLTADAFHQL
jgi:hypothetical protein